MSWKILTPHRKIEEDEENDDRNKGEGEGDDGEQWRVRILDSTLTSPDVTSLSMLPLASRAALPSPSLSPSRQGDRLVN